MQRGVRLVGLVGELCLKPGRGIGMFGLGVSVAGFCQRELRPLGFELFLQLDSGLSLLVDLKQGATLRCIGSCIRRVDGLSRLGQVGAEVAAQTFLLQSDFIEVALQFLQASRGRRVSTRVGRDS